MGASLQRVGGLGFALIAAPFLVLLLGPHAGITLTNLLTFIVSATTFVAMRSHVDTHRAKLLVPSGLVGVVPGFVAINYMSAGPLMVVEGGLIILGLAMTRLPWRLTEGVHYQTTAYGLASGFMTVTAGVGGPALAVYAMMTDWKRQEFVATAQL